MSEDFAFMHGIKSEDMNASLLVHTPAGQCQTSMVSHDVTVEIEGLEFVASPIVLKSCSIDLILGMNWLKRILLQSFAPLRPSICYTLQMR